MQNMAPFCNLYLQRAKIYVRQYLGLQEENYVQMSLG